MMIGEFNSRFASDHEGGALFEALREVSRRDAQWLLADDTSRWDEWPPDGTGDDPPSGLRLSTPARGDA